MAAPEGSPQLFGSVRLALGWGSELPRLKLDRFHDLARLDTRAQRVAIVSGSAVLICTRVDESYEATPRGSRGNRFRQGNAGVSIAVGKESGSTIRHTGPTVARIMHSVIYTNAAMHDDEPLLHTPKVYIGKRNEGPHGDRTYQGVKNLNADSWVNPIADEILAEVADQLPCDTSIDVSLTPGRILAIENSSGLSNGGGIEVVALDAELSI